MIDINTHKVIDMIASREKDVVTKWELLSYVKTLYLEKNYSIKKIELVLGLNYRTIKNILKQMIYKMAGLNHLGKINYPPILKLFKVY